MPPLIRQLGKHKYDSAICDMNEQGLSTIQMYKWYGTHGSGHGGFTSYIDRVEGGYIERREYFDGSTLNMRIQ